MEIAKVGLVNSPFSQDAGPPIIPLKLAYWRSSLNNNYDVPIYDLNLEIYKWLNYDVDAYNLLACIFGGYSFSFPFSAFLPFNEYPFEVLPTVNLLLAFMYGERVDSVYEVLSEVTERYGIPYKKASLLIDKFVKFIKKFAKDVNTNDCLIINMPLPASVIPGIFFSYCVKCNNPVIKIIGAGNQINVPEIGQLALSTRALDSISSGDDELFIKDTVASVLQLKDSKSLIPCSLHILSDLNELPMPDYEGFNVKEYPIYYGLMVMPLETSRGCPFKCNFCSERLCWDMCGHVKDEYRTKSIDRVMEEITYLSDQFNVTGMVFEDCIMNAYLPRFHNLLSHLQATDLLYSGLVRVDRLDRETIEKMHKARFTHVIMGVESFSKSSIAMYNKGGPLYVDKAYEAIPQLLSKGIVSQFNILICHPYESYPNVAEAIERCKDFARFIETQGFSFTDAPVGTICINYPSANYFRILKDPNFHIAYHRVPECLRKQIPAQVKNCVENLPYVAVRKDFSQYKNVNKVTLSLKIYDLWSKDTRKVIHQKVAAMSQYSSIILKGWMNHNIVIKYIKGNNIQVESTSPIYSLLSKISKEPTVSISSILTEMKKSKDGRNSIPEERLVPLLLTLSMEEIIVLERERPI